MSWERKWRKPDFQPPWLSAAPRPFVLTGFENGWLKSGMSVLEIGCGRGSSAAWLAERELRITGIDFSKSVIAQARKLFPNRAGLTFLHADACGATSLADSFDVVIDTGCLQHIPKGLHQRYRENLLLWSKVGGRFVVTMQTNNVSAETRLAEAKKLFSAPFELVHIEEVPTANPEVLSNPNSVFHFIRRQK